MKNYKRSSNIYTHRPMLARIESHVPMAAHLFFSCFHKKRPYLKEGILITITNKLNKTAKIAANMKTPAVYLLV